MNNFSASYEKILEVLKNLVFDSNFKKQIRLTKLNNLELIAINLTSEYLSIDSECQLFRVLPKQISNKIERSVYYRRKRNLLPIIEEIRKKLSDGFNKFEAYYIVDSMPLEIAKLSRSNRSRICKESFYSAPNRGYCACQKMNYYGYKLHAVCSINGVCKSIDLSKASVHDVHYLKDIKQQFSDCTIIANKL